MQWRAMSYCSIIWSHGWWLILDDRDVHCDDDSCSDNDDNNKGVDDDDGDDVDDDIGNIVNDDNIEGDVMMKTEDEWWLVTMAMVTLWR